MGHSNTKLSEAIVDELKSEISADNVHGIETSLSRLAASLAAEYGTIEAGMMLRKALLGIAEARAKSECPPNPNNQIKKVVVISIDRNEKYYYHGEPINLHDISNEVILHNEEPANIQFLISADTNTPYGSVLRLVETLQRAQVSKIAMLGMQGYLCVSDLPVEYMTPESQHAADMAAQEAAE